MKQSYSFWQQAMMPFKCLVISVILFNPLFVYMHAYNYIAYNIMIVLLNPGK